MLFPLSSLNQSWRYLQGIHPLQGSICPWSFIMILQLDESLCTFKTSFFKPICRINITKIDLCFSHSHLSTNLHQICREYIPYGGLFAPKVPSWSSNWTGHCALSRLLFEAYGVLALQKLIYAFSTLISRPIFTKIAGNTHPHGGLLAPEVSSWSCNWTGHCAPSRFLFSSLWRINITKIDLCFSHSHLLTNLDDICRNTSLTEVYLPLKFHHDPLTVVTVHHQDFFFQTL